jgi:hypothetical protein
LEAGGTEITLHAKQTDDVLVGGFVLVYECITYLGVAVLELVGSRTPEGSNVCWTQRHLHLYSYAQGYQTVVVGEDNVPITPDMLSWIVVCGYFTSVQEPRVQ